MQISRLLMTAAAAVLLATPALANSTVSTPPSTMGKTYSHLHHDPMMGMDANHDGEISKQEWLERAGKKFDALDSNHDGKLSKAELAASRQAMMKHMHDHWKHASGADKSAAPGAGGETAR